MIINKTDINNRDSNMPKSVERTTSNIINFFNIFAICHFSNCHTNQPWLSSHHQSVHVTCLLHPTHVEVNPLFIHKLSTYQNTHTLTHNLENKSELQETTLPSTICMYCGAKFIAVEFRKLDVKNIMY